MSLEQVRSVVGKDIVNFIDCYRVYAQLRRFGYIIFRHDPKRNKKSPPSSSSLKKDSPESTSKVIYCDNQYNLYTDLKRKHSDLQTNDSNLKKLKLVEKGSVLKNDSRYPDFGHVFRNLQVFGNLTEACNHTELIFDFDLYRPKRDFKKSSCNSPSYRIILLRNLDQDLPCEICIRKAKYQLNDNVPVLITRAGIDNISYFSLSSIDASLNTLNKSQLL
ncbi:uncharacterized protein LOC113363622 [Ctenocephalides felis]|uniref:uncharacterized protein LOC113363622 n=1 Tax=Ctenocephalides felis TaxID=7515 RepID=UPI000E6E505A|nr:uncharacterized protein LOC113363622 [Ctenocephalides felis]